ncbi:hypothetical protein Cgig2_006575 [Carnegiea gigantea]|uniref:Uncharacterized protein n=1 Tax=Carnegiea gigantea TaxID=171969 RepID=A0A9Q1JK43_9CARY|nr:hypothetical protein Cgig2_006575 [Carnegiea gigantea]
MDWGLFPNFANTEQAAEYVRDHFQWSLTDPTDPGPRPLPSDYHGPCPRFDLEMARRYAHDSYIPEIVQKVFYAMVIDDAAESGLSQRLAMDCASGPADPPANPVLEGDPPGGRMSSFLSFRDTVQAVEYVGDNLRWSKRETSSLRPNLLPWNFSAYCPEFNHIMGMQFAQATYISEMVQAVFYAMVINDATRLQLIRRETGKGLISDLRKLRWDAIEAWLLFIEDKIKMPNDDFSAKGRASPPR